MNDLLIESDSRLISVLVLLEIQYCWPQYSTTEMDLKELRFNSLNHIHVIDSNLCMQILTHTQKLVTKFHRTLCWDHFHLHYTMLPLGNIIRTHRIHVLCYAEDTQLISMKPDNTNQSVKLQQCVKYIKICMISNFLLLN